MTAERFLESIRRDTDRGRIRHWITRPARDAEVAQLPRWVHPDLAETLRRRGMDRIHSHQREAMDAIAANRDVLLTTPAGSGKSLATAIPILSALAEGETGRALIIRPTRRLAGGRVQRLRALVESLRRPVRVGGFDGDTPPSTRQPFRERVDVVVTTPEILHGRILPHHPHWAPVLRDLRWIVVENLERYDGAFGSQVANVLRRLVRVAAHHDSSPIFVTTGEAIGNPVELATAITGRRPIAVTRSGAPESATTLLVCEPGHDAERGRTASVLEETRRRMEAVPDDGAGTIVFTAPAGVAPLLETLRRDRRDTGRDPAGVASYAMADLPAVRNEVERRFAAGEVRTLLLPHGVEPGPDAVHAPIRIVAGGPPSLAGLRRELAGAEAALLIAGPTAIDHAWLRRPQRLTNDGGPEYAVDPDNLVVLLAQLQCAAYEIPFADGERFGGLAETHLLLEHLEREWRVLHRTDGRWYWAASDYPADGVILRDVERDEFAVVDRSNGNVLARVDRARAAVRIHPGAILRLGPETFEVDALEWSRRHAVVRRAAPGTVTEAEVETEVRVLSVDEGEEFDAYRIERGDVELTTVVPRYRRRTTVDEPSTETFELDLPAEVTDADALWIGLAPRAEEALGGGAGERCGGLQGFATLLRRVVPLAIRCRRGDLGVVVEPRSGHSGRASITLHETTAGGVGLTTRCYDLFPRLLALMEDVLADCACTSGCAICVGGEREVGPDGKAIARALVEAFRAATPRVDRTTRVGAA